MSRKRLKLPIHLEINSNNQWEKLLEGKELIVVDVYSSWCGPCTSMVSTIRKIKQQVGDDVTFAVAKSDHISHLEQFRHKSEPTWLFISEGKIVNVMYGCNSAKLVSMTSKELKKEILIQKGEATRENLDIGDVAKEEAPLVKPPPELPTPVVKQEVTPMLTDEEFPYRPFTVSYL